MAASPASFPLPVAWRRLAMVLCPPAATQDDTAWAETERLAGAALARRPTRVQHQLRWFVLGIEWLALAYAGGRFSRLSPAKQVAMLGRLERSRWSPLRRALWGLRTLAMLGVYGRPGMRDALGWRPDPRGWAGRTAAALVRPTPARGTPTLRLVP